MKRLIWCKHESGLNIKKKIPCSFRSYAIIALHRFWEREWNDFPLHSSQFSVVFLLDWLLFEARELSLPCYSTHNWIEKRKWKWILTILADFTSRADNCSAIHTSVKITRILFKIVIILLICLPGYAWHLSLCMCQFPSWGRR